MPLAADEHDLRVAPVETTDEPRQVQHAEHAETPAGTSTPLSTQCHHSTSKF